MANTDDLVTLSGVSRSTLFRFLRGGTVRPPAKEAILSAMRQLDMPYEPVQIHKGKTLQISVRHDFRSFKGYGQAIAGFMARAEAQGFQVNLRTGNLLDPENPASAKRKHLVKSDGVLIIGMTRDEEDYEIRCYREAGIPHVFVNRNFEDPSVSWVACNLRLAARDATDHLLDLGHAAIGTWGLTAESRLDADKRKGFIEAFAARGMAVDETVCLDMHTHGDMETAVQKLMDEKKMPGAWFCCSDEHALRLYKLARSNGIRIPEDLAVVSMDDAETSEYLTPALTTIRMPFQREGAIAFDILTQLMKNPEEESVRILLKHRLIVRESCGAPK